MSCDNTIRDSCGPGILFVARAKATCADNRVFRGHAAGFEAAERQPLVLRRLDGVGGIGLLVHDGGRGDFRENVVINAWAGQQSLWRGTHARLRAYRLLDCRSGVGLLIRDGASGEVEANEVCGHQLAGLEIGAHSAPIVSKNVISRNRSCGIFIAPNGGGMLQGNTVEDNALHGIECRSHVEDLLLEGNTVSGHAKGVGLVVALMAVVAGRRMLSSERSWR